MGNVYVYKVIVLMRVKKDQDHRVLSWPRVISVIENELLTL